MEDGPHQSTKPQTPTSIEAPNLKLQIKARAMSLSSRTAHCCLELGTSLEQAPACGGLSMEETFVVIEKHFTSWLGLCPDNRISGGKVLSSHTRKVISRVSDALRIAATSLERSQSAMGGFYRRMKARLGDAEAVTATAHKLARIIYRLIKFGEAYVRQGIEDYERKFQERKMYALTKTAKAMGFKLTPLQAAPPGVS